MSHVIFDFPEIKNQKQKKQKNQNKKILTKKGKI